MIKNSIMALTFPELFSKLAVAPMYIIVLVLCIGYLFFTWKDRGIFVFIHRIYSVIIIAIYLISLYFHFFY
jgi:hypothetical protein